jgi:tripartite-type tricarboxylate transporter receptor subunit TctC
MTASDIRCASPASMFGVGPRRFRPSMIRVLAVRIARSVTGVLAAAVLLAGTQAAPAQTYPTKPIRLIVPYAAGGGTDAVARSVGKRLTETFGQPIVIENRPGANGAIGTAMVAKSPADGYTLLLVTSSHVINPAVMKALPYDPLADFTPVTIVAISPVVIVTGTGQPFATMQEMIAYVKTKAGQLSIGNSDPASMLMVETLKQAAGLDLQQVAYKGGGALVADVIGNHIPVGAMSTGTAFPHYKSGKMRVLAVTPSKRTPSMPEVPTVAESGVPGFNMQIWFGLLGPAGLPAPIAERLQQEIAKVLAEEPMIAHLAELGMEGKGTPPAETAATMRADAEVWAAAAKAAGVKPE